MHRLAVIVVLFVVVLGLAWDGLVIVLGKCAYGDTFCQAVRDLNADSQGLFALCTLALWIHIFLLPWLPAWWRQ